MIPCLLFSYNLLDRDVGGILSTTLLQLQQLLSLSRENGLVANGKEYMMKSWHGNFLHNWPFVPGTCHQWSSLPKGQKYGAFEQTVE